MITRLFTPTIPGKGQKGGSSLKKNVECYNCGKRGQYKKACWEEGSGKEGQGPKQKGKWKGKGEGKGKEKEMAAATDKKKEKEEKPKDEEVWMAMVMDDNSEEISYNKSINLHDNSYYEEAYSWFINDNPCTYPNSLIELMISRLIYPSLLMVLMRHQTLIRKQAQTL